MTISLGSSGVDFAGNYYVEGTVQENLTVLCGAPANEMVSVMGSINIIQPKTIMIVRPENSQFPVLNDDGSKLPGILQPDTYNADQTAGFGDSRWNTIRQNWGSENWSAALLGTPWPSASDFPSSAYRIWHWYDSLSGDAESGSCGVFTVGPDTFYDLPRPYHDYPWSGYIPLNALDECQNPALPPPDQAHINLHLTDSDQTNGKHPQWNFDQTANFYLLYHNRYENATNIGHFPTPLTDNPWRQYHPHSQGNGPLGNMIWTSGLQPEKDANGNNTNGTYPWNPGSVNTYVEVGWTDTLSDDVAQGSITVNNGTGSTQNVPLKTVPVQFEGGVYYRFGENRTQFNYFHYLVGGRHILGFDPVTGKEIPHVGKIDVPNGGIEYTVWVQKAGSNWPETTTLDLASM